VRTPRLRRVALLRLFALAARDAIRDQRPRVVNAPALRGVGLRLLTASHARRRASRASTVRAEH
jgi:hypothetical protein